MKKNKPLKVVVVNPPTKEEADRKIEEISKSLNAIYGKNGMKNRTTKNINENNNELSEADVLASLLNIYEDQESIKITAKIKSLTNKEEYLYKDKKVNKIK